MKKYTCNIETLCTGKIIAGKGDSLELDEKDPETKVLLFKKLISPVEKQVIHKPKTKK